MLEFSPAARHKARRYAMQALYQWQMTQEPLNHIEAHFRVSNEKRKTEWDFFSALLHGVPAQLSELDALIKTAIVNSFESINPVELAILRLGVYELKERIDVPYKTVINEYVNLSKEFGVEGGHKFVNKVLDKLAGELRSVEKS